MAATNTLRTSWPSRLAPALLITALVRRAFDFDAGRRCLLFFLHKGKHFSLVFVVSDRRVADALLLVKHLVRQHHALPAQLNAAIGKLVSINVFTRQLLT